MSIINSNKESEAFEFDPCLFEDKESESEVYPLDLDIYQGEIYENSTETKQNLEGPNGLIQIQMISPFHEQVKKENSSS